MADIVEADVKIYKAEDQTDSATGGGRMSSDVVVSGEVNNLFPNISRIDRLQGRIQPRKVFQKIDSANAAVYSGAHLIIRDMPLDENVSVLMFPTDDHNDRLTDIVDYMESYYVKSTPVGNAGLEYAVLEGAEQLVFKVRHYEYTPNYDQDGQLVYTLKIDAKYTLNVTVGDLLMLDDGAGTLEHIHVQQMQRVTETLDNSDAKHYYIVEYIILTLSAGLMNGWAAGTVPFRSARNTAWKCYGAMLLAADAAAADVDINLVSTRARLAPVISREIAVSDQAFFGPGTMANDVAVGADGIEWLLDQAEEINASESIPSVAGKTSYTHVLQNKPLKASTLQIWYRANLGWYVITESAGVLSGNGTGTVSADGVVVFTLPTAADPDTRIMLYYSREHNLAEIEGVLLASPDVVYQENQVSVAAETETITGVLPVFPVQSGFIRLSIDTGAGFVPFGVDSGFGVITGDNIEAGTFNYMTGAWSITFASPYTGGVVLKWESVPLTPNTQNDSGGSSGFSGYRSGSVAITLSRIKIDPGSVSITIKTLYRAGQYSMAGQSIVITDNGSGVLSGNGDGTASGSINYDTGMASITFTFTNPIAGQFSWFAWYLYFSDTVYSQTALPYRFSVGYADVIPESLLIKYFTAGVAAPWYARDIAGVLELEGSLPAGTPGTSFTSIKTFNRAFFLNGQWVIAATNDVLIQAQHLFQSIDGLGWSSITHNIADKTRLKYFAAKATGPKYVGVGTMYVGGKNLGVSSDLISWALQDIGPSAAFLGVVYAAGIDMFIAHTASAIWTSTDDGATWTNQTSAIAGNMNTIVTADFGSGEIVLIFGQNNQVQASADGVEWTVRQSNLLAAVVGAGSMIVDGQPALFAADVSGAVSKTVDGVNFELLSTGLSGTPISFATDGVFFLLAALDDGTVDMSRDGGVTWQNLAMDHQWETVTTHHLIFAAAGGGWLHMSLGHDGADADAMLPAIMPLNVMVDESGDPIKIIGTFDPATGIGEITAGDLPVSAQARYFLTERRLTDFVVFSFGATPLTVNSFTAFGTTYTGAMLMLSEDPANPGVLIGDGSGTIDKASGIAQCTFSFPIRPESLRLSYSYGSIYRPEYDEINTRAMPLDGLVPVCQDGDVAVIVEHARTVLTAAIDDIEMAADVDAGAIFPDREITVKIEDEELIGTMSGDTFSITTRGANTTTAAAHAAGAVMELISRREEMLPILAVNGNRVTSPNPLLYDYKAGGAILTTAIVKGDLQALETGHHSQASWNGTLWEDADDYTGNPADGTYNFTDNPVLVTNLGCETERWLLEIASLSPTLVDIRGESLGVIATDVPISSAIAPINPNTGAAYFTIAAAGWGAGWQVGNVIRIDTQMAGGPAWITRVINARASNIEDDHATIQSRGDVAV